MHTFPIMQAQNYLLTLYLLAYISVEKMMLTMLLLPIYKWLKFLQAGVGWSFID